MKYDLEFLVKNISRVSHFKNLPESAYNDIAMQGQVLRYTAGSSIFHEGDTSAGMFVLLAGCVHLCKEGVHGQETIIAVIKPVIMFNEITVIDKGPNPVTAHAIEDSISWQINYQNFQLLLRRYPQVGTGLLGVMARRNRLMLSHLEDIISRPILARVAKTLLDLSQQGQKPINRRKHSNIEIAARVATVHEAISRSIKTLYEMGAITYSREEIVVVDKTRLAELAQVSPIELTY
jgi:CRP/FNR family transcriptional regulator